MSFILVSWQVWLSLWDTSKLPESAIHLFCLLLHKYQLSKISWHQAWERHKSFSFCHCIDGDYHNGASHVSTKSSSVGNVLSKIRRLCVPGSGRQFLDSSQSVTPKRGRDNICDEKLSAAALFCLPTYFGSAVSRATASSCWLQYKSSRNKRIVCDPSLPTLRN